MIKLQEFENLVNDFDKENPFCAHYLLESGEDFYIEPAFYTQLQGFKEQFKDRYEEIIVSLLNKVKTNKKVVFTGNYEGPLTDIDGYIYLEITDITDPLKIYAEDKSRGSDYGD